MSDGPIRPSRGAAIQHLVLRVRDIEASHRFYTEVLGFEQCATLSIPEYEHIDMRFYRGGPDRHHDLALVQLDDAAVAGDVPDWMMFGPQPGIDHVGVSYPSREAWLDQIAWMQSQGVEFKMRGDHGMTHSAYVVDPDGHGIEVLYDLPAEVWSGDVNAALNHYVELPLEGDGSLADDTEYVRFGT